MNDINFPAGILQPPFFDPEIDPAVNFGGIGVVIGHEMTHGFDDQGSKYDGKGQPARVADGGGPQEVHRAHGLRGEGVRRRSKRPGARWIAAQNLNGKLTLGENTADNGGLRIAYMALLDTLAKENKTVDEKIDGYTEAQRYFIGFAQVWCSNQTEQSARQLALTDPHSPGQVAGERQRAELRRVRQGVRLPQGPADVSGEFLPSLVEEAPVRELPGTQCGQLRCSRDSLP